MEDEEDQPALLDILSMQITPQANAMFFTQVSPLKDLLKHT